VREKEGEKEIRFFATKLISVILYRSFRASEAGCLVEEGENSDPVE